MFAHKQIILFFGFIACLICSNLESCSTFLLEKNGQKFLAKSFDWSFEDGLVVVNKRNMAKKALTQDNPMEWVSKYGSITFAQGGRELPMGGINENGLIVEVSWLSDTSYPMPDSRKTINELQWIQYQLDTAKTVEEVIASDKILRIDPTVQSTLHFFVADSKGRVATIEFINGCMVAHSGNNLVTPVLTNDPYEKSIEFLKQCQGFGGNLEVPPKSVESLDRFARIATLLKRFSTNDQPASPSLGFSILAKAAKPTTQWNIVYDFKAKAIHFLTASHRSIRTIFMKAFDFEGNTNVQVLDMQAKLSGDVSHQFIPYTFEMNRKLVNRCCDELKFLKPVPEEYRKVLASFPETTRFVGAK